MWHFSAFKKVFTSLFICINVISLNLKRNFLFEQIFMEEKVQNNKIYHTPEKLYLFWSLENKVGVLDYKGWPTCAHGVVFKRLFRLFNHNFSDFYNGKKKKQKNMPVSIRHTETWHFKANASWWVAFHFMLSSYNC